MAAAGKLVLMIGADKDTLERVRPILQTFGESLLHMGAVGQGAIAKVVNNAMGQANFVAALWFGILAPAGTPKTAISRLQQEIAALLRTPEVNDWQKSNAAEPGGMPPDEFGAYLKSEFSKRGKVVREAGIRAD